ncbi:hypothetical protein [Pseudomonas sp. 6D_7.1_Bac1]|uniref:hypothetical protein n=1 Tax=Pseudomonas sp. 6D_7.1_Bac1 TaxID=2971615 RepID=UPI0021C8F333|nr:hypothetical protein [Pseudomonas sp. 6D_7.1_Bac1]MCU1752166.1 hypothetical protein [Pseudomonas sp. 6D_7.1_Bac1]
MKLIGARQAWTDSQHESNASITAAAIDSAQSAATLKKTRARQHEVVFAAMGDDKEERILATRQRISISETRRKPIGRSTARAAHLVTMGKIQRAIETLPFQVQQLGHFLYHPCITMLHVMNAEKLISARADFSGLSDAKKIKAECLITMALRSYKGEVSRAAEWGPVRISEEMKAFYGVVIEITQWARDWKGVWDSLKEVIKEVDLDAQQPVWQVIHSENEESAA